MRTIKFVGMCLFLLLGVTQLSHSQDLIKVGEVTNEIRLGPFAGNRNLSLGVKNILEELLMDLEYDLSPNAEKQINIRLVFFDVTNIGKNVGVYHNKVSATQIIAIGELQEGGTIKKKTTQKGVSKEISNSTLVVASDGSFNQQTASIALKKVLAQIVKDLL
jgi:hypothetical protein